MCSLSSRLPGCAATYVTLHSEPLPSGTADLEGPLRLSPEFGRRFVLGRLLGRGVRPEPSLTRHLARLRTDHVTSPGVPDRNLKVRVLGA